MEPPAYIRSEKSNSTLVSSSNGASSDRSFTTQFASLSLHRHNRIRLLQFPQVGISAIGHIFKTSWYKGLQDERAYANSYEFKCYGNPWIGQSSDYIPARILMREILAYLFSQGWILHSSTDVSRKITDKDTMIFRKQDTPESEWTSMSFNQGDKMRLIGAEQELITAFGKLLKRQGLLQSEAWKDEGMNAYEFKIIGYPWKATAEETMTTRLLLLKMLECLESFGWSLYASVDQNATNSDMHSETESWYCVRNKDWTSGDAVFHR